MVSDLGLRGATPVHSGKVRDLYAVGDDEILMVASDKISAYDYVLTPDIPDKGRVLTGLSLWWFDQLLDVAPHHVRSVDVPDALRGRAVICERLDMVAVECVARGYLAGSGLADYQRTGSIGEHRLPVGLQDGSALPEPIFTPTTKAPLGEHDESMSFARVAAQVGAELAGRLRDLTLAIYRRGEQVARARGVILADTKVEFGLRPDGTVVLADEVLTPDSSRFWPADQWEPGHPQPSFDKQFVRDWLASPDSGWDRAAGDPPPTLPGDVVAKTRARYVEAYERITGQPF